MGARVCVALLGLPRRLHRVSRCAGAGEQPAPDAAAREAFIAECRARDFDLAIQLHGSGTTTNAIVASLGATRTAGFVPADGGATRLDHTLAWRDDEPEVTRYLALMRALGYAEWGDYLEFPLGGLARCGRATSMRSIRGAT